MRPNQQGEVILEGTLEARVVAQLLTAASQAHLVDSITPPIEPPTIGRMDFISKLSDELKGQGDTKEYTIPTSTIVPIMKTLAAVAEIVPPGQATVSRRKYLGQKLVELNQKIETMISPPKRMNIEVGDVTLVGVTEEQASLAKRREAFINAYLGERGWSLETLNVEQLKELRSQPDWENPPELA